MQSSFHQLTFGINLINENTYRYVYECMCMYVPVCVYTIALLSTIHAVKSSVSEAILMIEI